MKSYEIKFLICVKNKSYKKKKINYSFPIIEYWSFYHGYKTGHLSHISFDPADINESDEMSIMAQMIVRDWLALEVIKRDDFVYGLANLKDDIVLHSQELKQSFINMINHALANKFNQEYINNYDGKEGEYLFTIDFTLNKDKCELLASENEFLLKQEL